MLGTCRLCLNEAKLIDSHIVARWAWKRAHAEHLRSPHPVVLGGGAAEQNGKQVSEYMLCRRCENLMKVGEDYAAQNTYQKDYRTAPLLDRVGLWIYEQEGFRVVAAGSLDTRKLAYFGLSVAWRASVSTVIPECKINAEHEDALRCYLLNATPLADDITCRATFYDIPYSERTHVASIFSLPYTESDGVITFMLYGLQFDIATGPLAEEWKPLCLVHGPEPTVTLAPQAHLLDLYGDWFLRQRPRGALAQRGVR